MMTPLSHLPPLPFLPLPQTYAPWPVWSDSTTQTVRFQPMPKKAAVRLWHRARDFDRVTRQPGRHGGAKITLRGGGRSLIASPLSMAFFCFLLLPYRGHGSLRGRKRPPQHLVRSTSAAMSTTGSHGVFMWPKALLRSRLHPRPVGQPLHPRRRFGCISVKHSLGGHRLLGPTEWLA